MISTDGRRVYLDDASVLVQTGALDPAGLPVAGAEQTAKARDPRGRPSNREMDAIVPGVASTGRPIRAAFGVVVGFEHSRVAYEHIYWDQADMLRQIGVLEGA